MSTADNSIKIGTVIEGYRIESFLGKGAMAVVYQATQLSLERPVALKILPGEFASDNDYVQRFFNEAKSAAALSHQNIVQAYDAGVTDNDICYFAMELVDGESLLDRVEREGPLNTATALQIMADIATALEYGWKWQKLTHGDIKPANILVNSAGIPKLADFGLAKIADFEFQGDGLMLTPLYAAPELIQGEINHENCASDVYSFGATIYHLLVGHPPFPGEDPEVVMRLQVNEPVVPVKDRNPNVPASVSNWVEKMLSKDPKKRPTSWENVLDKNQTLLHDILYPAPALSPKKIKLAKNAASHLHYTGKKLSTRMNKRKKIVQFVSLTLLIVANIIAAYLFLAPAEKNKTDQKPTPTEVPNANNEIKSHEKDKTPMPDSSTLEIDSPPSAGDSEHGEETTGQLGQDKTMPDNIEERTIIEPPTAEPTHEKQEPKPKPINDYMQLLNQLHVDFQLDSQMESATAICDKWLHKHDYPSREKNKVQFIKNEMLPRLQRIKSALASNGKQLSGLSLPGFDEYTITDVTTESVELIMLIRRETTNEIIGRLRKKIPWNELYTEENLSTLQQYLIADPTVEIEDKLPALAYFSLRGHSGVVADTIEKMPAFDNSPLWVETANDLTKALRIQQADELMQKYQYAIDNQNLDDAANIFGQLEAMKEFLDAEQAQKFHKLKAFFTSDAMVRATKIIGDAQRSLATNPIRTLLLLNFLKSRHQEIAELNEVNSTALQERAFAQILQRSPMRDLQTGEDAIAKCIPFTKIIESDIFQPVPALAFWLAETKRLPTPEPIFERNPTWYEIMGLLELGDWNQAYMMLNKTSIYIDEIPPLHQAAAVLAEKTLKKRYENASVADLPNQIAHIAERTDDFRQKNIIEILALKAALASDSNSNTPWAWRRKVDATQTDDVFEKYRILYGLVYLAELEEFENFKNELNRIEDDAKINRRQILSESEITALRQAAGINTNEHENNKLDSIAMKSAPEFNDICTRIRLSALMNKKNLKPMKKLQMAATLSTACEYFNLASAETWFRITLMKVAKLMNENELQAAIELCEKALQNFSPYANRYSSQLQILTAAMYNLADNQELAKLKLNDIKQWNVVSPMELAATKYLLHILNTTENNEKTIPLEADINGFAMLIFKISTPMKPAQRRRQLRISQLEHRTIEKCRNEVVYAVYEYIQRKQEKRHRESLNPTIEERLDHALR